MIEAHGLVKRYGSTMAVNDLSFSIRPGMVTRLPRPERRREPRYGVETFIGGGKRSPCTSHAREPSKTKFAEFGLRWHRLSPSKAAGPSL
jgi:hypothetical protein